jgi:hypothetical protein
VDLVRLLQYSKNDEGLSVDEKDAWGAALEAIDQDESPDDEEAQPEKPLGRHARSNSKDGSPPDSSHPSQGGRDAASGPETINASYRHRRRTVSIGQSKADFKLQRKDKYGIVIPHFSQVGESLVTLGVGRCVKVNKDHGTTDMPL